MDIICPQAIWLQFFKINVWSLGVIFPIGVCVPCSREHISFSLGSTTWLRAHRLGPGRPKFEFWLCCSEIQHSPLWNKPSIPTHWHYHQVDISVLQAILNPNALRQQKSFIWFMYLHFGSPQQGQLVSLQGGGSRDGFGSTCFQDGALTWLLSGLVPSISWELNRDLWSGILRSLPHGLLLSVSCIIVQYGGSVLRVSVPRAPGGMCIAFYDPAPEVIECHFHLSHKPIWIQALGSPDSTSWWEKWQMIGGEILLKLCLESKFCHRAVRM